MIRKLEISRALRPSFSKAIVMAVILCAFVMFRYGTTNRVTPAKSKTGTARHIGSNATTITKAAAATAPASAAAPAQVAPTATTSVAKKVSSVESPIRVASAVKPVRKSTLRPPPAPKVSPTPVGKTANEDDDGEDGDGDGNGDGDDNRIVDGFLENAPSESELVIEITAPLDEVADKALAENSLAGDYQVNTLESPTQLDSVFALDRELPREQRLVLTEGFIKPNGFSELREKLAYLKSESESLQLPVAPPPAAPRPEPTLVVPANFAKATADKPAERQETAQQLTPPSIPGLPPGLGVISHKEVILSGPGAVAHVTPPVTSPVTASITAPAARETVPPRPEIRTEISAEPELVRPAPAAHRVVKVSAEPIDPDRATEGPQLVAPSVAPSLAGVGTLPTPPTQAVVATQQVVRHFDARADLPVKGQLVPESAGTKGEPELVLPGPKPPEPDGKLAAAVRSGLPQPRKHANREPELVRGQTEEDDTAASPEGGVISGRLALDRDLDAWLASQKGHIELYLHPLKSRDPQDTIFIDYQYPDEDFEIDATQMKGKYRLVAGIFTPKAPTAIAQLGYPRPVSAEDYKRPILFTLKKASFDNAQKLGMSRSPSLVLTATLFEGANSNYRQPKVIRNAKVRILGFDGLGTFFSDSEGNIRVPNVPGHSELILEVTADGYYNAYPTIPTFGTNVYSAIYLISKDKVDAITKYFTRSAQDPRKGIVLGRVFDPTSRAPLGDERLQLSFRRGRALYFDALPDPWLPATTTTGLFGFFNVGPSFRSLSRESGKPALLLNVRPNSALYIELGRGGKKNLTGRLSDPFSDHIPVARVRLVGAPGVETYTDKDGRFQLKDIDFPPGVITLEVEAEGFPISWHSIPWNTRERDTTHSLFMLEKELITESAAAVAHVKMRRDRGSVVGGAENAFFTRKQGCIYVGLEDPFGGKLDPEIGPYPLTGGPNPKDKPLCLTAQKPGFTFFNVPAGEYILKWLNQSGQTFRTRIIHVGVERVSVVVN